MTATNPAHQFLQQPKSEVGTYALDIANLSSQGVPLPITFCIPVSALELIAHHNQLQKKFEVIRQNLDYQDQPAVDSALDKIKQAIRQQAYPKQVSNKILDYYSNKLDKDFIRLTASPIHGYETDYKREDNIKGEANMMESILKLWARNLQRQHLKHETLFPVAIVIQAQFQPDSSGQAYSLNTTTQDKSQILIEAVHGVYRQPDSELEQDVFTVDQRSWEIKEQDISIQHHYWQRQLDQLQRHSLDQKLRKKASLSTQQIKELAQLVKKIKLRHVNQIRVHWSLIQGQIIISKIKPHFVHTSKQQPQQSLKTVAVGTSLNPGYVAAQCQIVTSQSDLKQFKTGQIAVVRQLTHNHQALVQTASGIVVEKSIASSQLLAKIRHYQLPTIIQARRATSKLKTGQNIILDSSAGKVYQPQTKHRQTSDLAQQTKTKLLLAVNDPHEIDQEMAQVSAGIGLLRSEHLFIQTGQHPFQILKTQRNQFQEKISQQFVSFYHRFISLKQQEPIIIYRSLNLNSQQLQKLRGGQQHETPGPNPFLGFRGALRKINQPQILNFELELINKINSKIDRDINLLLPFVRTNFELQQLQTHITHQIERLINQPQLWLELTTPENLINIEEYLQTPIAGVSINVKDIHALLHGIDPSFRDVFDQYSPNTSMLQKLINQTTSAIRHYNENIKINLNLSNYNQALIKMAVANQYAAITVRPEIARQTKQQILKLEP